MLRLTIVITLAVLLAGCATMPHTPSGPARPGIYHEVERGETLWYISNLYDVKLGEIIKSNRMPDASKIEVGQLIFIPGGGVPKKAKLENFIWPVRGQAMPKNKGIDIRTQAGCGIVASRSGRVTFVNEHLKGYGKTIIIDHFDGFETVYAHNRENLVSINQDVKQGEVIARAGRTGRAQTATLHFEIRKKHKPQNPFYYLP